MLYSLEPPVLPTVVSSIPVAVNGLDRLAEEITTLPEELRDRLVITGIEDDAKSACFDSTITCLGAHSYQGTMNKYVKVSGEMHSLITCYSLLSRDCRNCDGATG